ncbi:MAG: sulfocyanin-like copper-binding protein [Candidatus Dormibacteria bacterium]
MGLAALLAGCGGTPYNAADSGVGCSVTVLIPSSGTTLLGTVEATVQGRTFHFSRNVNTISVDCGERASLSATAADPQAHPFTDWTLRGKVSSAARLTVTVDGSLAIRPGFRVPRKPTPTPTPTPSATPSTVTLDQWVSYDPATKSVTWKVVAAYQDVNHGLSFDGEARGAMKVAVPVGWSVTVDFSNVGTVNHSAVIVTPTGTTPVFPGAGTPNPTLGTAPGQTATYTFTASTAGSYRLACLTPGHEGAGMWETFTVTSAGRPTATL